ncbi:MAG: superoxide dismutase, Fe-Mn family [Mycobacterium sp.]|nr:superoxide dismutase, Fe-Mn family [Mycobacterium sp.]
MILCSPNRFLLIGSGDRPSTDALVSCGRRRRTLRGGHGNHSIWWKNLSPNGGDRPTGDLAAAIDDQFGSFEKFQAQFTAAANGLQGSDWAVLGYDSLGDRLLCN